MQKYDSLITVRTSSSRLPGKCLLRFGNEESLLEYIVKRALSYGLNPIICTSVDHSDDIIEEISNKCNIPCFRGSLTNKMKRWLDCAEFYKLNYFHTIDADDPFFDGHRMKHSLDALTKFKYDYVRPSDYSDSGAGTEGYSIFVPFLKKVCAIHDSDSLDTEMAVYYFEQFEDARYLTLSNPVYAIDIDKEIPRLTLDFFEDYIYLNALSFAIDHVSKREEIESLLLKCPSEINFNVKLNIIWKNNQLQKRIIIDG
jgi:spore coat polysaccharide biosynthesis protein SpsF